MSTVYGSGWPDFTPFTSRVCRSRRGDSRMVSRNQPSRLVTRSSTAGLLPLTVVQVCGWEPPWFVIPTLES